MAHTRPRTKIRRPWPSQKEELDLRLLLFRVIRRDTTAAAQRQRKHEKCGVSIVLLGCSGPEWLPVVICQNSRLRRPRARTTDLGRGPHLRRGVHAGSLRASQAAESAREEDPRPPGEKSRSIPGGKKAALVHCDTFP